VDPRETGSALQAGEDREPGPPVVERGGQLVSASGKGKT
jgi:hypothetical protein